MISRNNYIKKLQKATSRSPITALLGPRQCGKTTLARMFSSKQETTFFDLESQPDVRRLQNPELVLSTLSGLVVLDEIQNQPSLFNVLRVMVDRPDNQARFLILGSASPDIVKNVSETLAGRVEFIELSGFNLFEIGSDRFNVLWVRGGFPRSYLAPSNEDSIAWREGFIRTFLERDIPQLGIRIPSQAMRRFWNMMAHHHGNIWNASLIGRAMGLNDKTVRNYLDILTGTYMIRQLPPWFENLSKRQVKSPKIYIRDSGLLHGLLNLPDQHTLLGHPQVGASWEGFALEHLISTLGLSESYFWATHSGAEIDLLFFYKGRRYGAEIKFTETPRPTKSIRAAIKSLNLEHVWIIYPGEHTYPIDDKISVLPISDGTAIYGKLK
jgi:predicted AAA+ superfamily ATPase